MNQTQLRNSAADKKFACFEPEITYMFSHIIWKKIVQPQEAGQLSYILINSSTLQLLNRGILKNEQ